MGLQSGDRVCILSQSRPEWSMVDFANLTTGIITVPIYQSSLPGDIEYILEHSQPKLIFAEDVEQLKKLKIVFQNLKLDIPILCFSDNTFDSFSNNYDSTTEEAFKSACKEVTEGTVASIVYTSGTTGKPKGALLTHSNFIAEVLGVAKKIGLEIGDKTVTFLPFAHILGRVESLFPLFTGIVLGFAENIASINKNILEIKPTLLVSVPRIYEKIYVKIQSEVSQLSPTKKSLFQWALGVGRKVALLRSEHKIIPPVLFTEFIIANQLVLKNIQKKLGGRLKLTISGGAPLSQELCEFFHACGIKILEGYGLTETTAALCVNFPNDYCFGTVGQPIDGVEIKIAADGEILVKGPSVFKEYYRNKEATEECVKNGWFHTGDIGEFNARGFLKITDRKKELIVTSAGKNVAPQKLENMLKSSQFISQAMIYGDQQKYLVALITLNEKLNEHVTEEIESHIKHMNQNLASFETIKKYKILQHDFTIESGELTPSLKIKRKVITQNYKNEILEMYS
jgi:long-chain acyl-CoA synthetase